MHSLSLLLTKHFGLQTPRTQARLSSLFPASGIQKYPAEVENIGVSGHTALPWEVGQWSKIIGIVGQQHMGGAGLPSLVYSLHSLKCKVVLSNVETFHIF